MSIGAWLSATSKRRHQAHSSALSALQVIKALQDSLPADSPVIARSSANVEDLAGLSGCWWRVQEEALPWLNILQH